MQKCNENAANRYSYVGEVYSFGERAKKKEILLSLPKEWRELHEKGRRAAGHWHVLHRLVLRVSFD